MDLVFELNSANETTNSFHGRLGFFICKEHAPFYCSCYILHVQHVERTLPGDFPVVRNGVGVMLKSADCRLRCVESLPSVSTDLSVELGNFANSISAKNTTRCHFKAKLRLLTETIVV